MHTLARRLSALEARHGAGQGCACRTIEYIDTEGRSRNPAPPLCPHGRPWLLVRQYVLGLISPEDEP